MLHSLKKILSSNSFLRLGYHQLLAVLACLLYRFPARKMIIVGITGTDGKTTTTNLITKVIKQIDPCVGMCSTINFKVGRKILRNSTHKTTLGPLELQKRLREIKNAGAKHCVLEVSSHAIHQHRLWGIPFDILVFTNLSHEHLDYHKTMEEYRRVKGLIFEKLHKFKIKISLNKKGFYFCPLDKGGWGDFFPKTIIVNGDDPEADYFLQFSADQKWKIKVRSTKYEVQNHNQKSKINTLVATNVLLSSHSTNFKAVFNYKLPQYHSIRGKQATSYKLNLLGDFNVYNALAAIAVGKTLGVPESKIKQALASIPLVPGRMELVKISPRQKFDVLLDYAVTPAAFEKLFSTCRKFSLPPTKKTSHKPFLPLNKGEIKRGSQKPGRLIAVFGACGDRDQGKRPILGEIASRLCDLIIITNEEPYTEDPEKIIDMICAGVEKSGRKSTTHNSQLTTHNYFRLSNRGDAIRFALKIAQPHDLIVITGMSDQDSMIVGTQKIPWSDRGFVKKELKRLFT